MCARPSEPAPGGAGPRRLGRVGWWLAPVLGLACFASSATNQFAYDDQPLIVDNPRIRNLTDFRALWLSDWWKLAESGPESNPRRDRLYRPLTLFSLALNYAVHGYRPLGYHVANIALHAAVCLLVWQFARRLVQDEAVATVAAVLFAVHPVHAEAVANVVGRAEVLAALFLLLGLLVLLPRAGRPGLGRVAGATPLFLLALLSKESAVCYPAVALLVLWFAQRGARRTWRWWAGALAVLLPPLLVYFPLRYLALDHVLFRGEPADVLMNPLVTAAAWQRAVGALTVLGHYARLILVPAKLSCDYGLAIIDPRHGVTALSLLGLVAALALLLALVGFWRGGALGRTLALLTALSLASYGLFSNTLLLIGVAVAERVMYWPSVPILMLVALGVVELWRRHCAPGQALAQSARLLRLLGVLLVAVLGLRAALRNGDWSNTARLFGSDVQTYPAGAYLNFGCAVELLKLAARTEVPEQRLAILQEALRYADTAVRLHPSYAEALALRGELHAQHGELDLALLDVETALELDPRNRNARATRQALLQGGDAGRRLAALRAQAAAQPDDPQARLELGRALLQSGLYEEARAALRRAVELAPENAVALRELAKVLYLTHAEDEARALFERVVTLDPEDWEAHTNLAPLLAHNDPAAALRHALRAHELRPGEPRTGINLAEAYEQNGQRAAAIELYQRVERGLDADDPLKRVVAQRLEFLRRR